MPKQTLKYFLTCQDKLVLANGTEKELHEKVSTLLNSKPAPTTNTHTDVAPIAPTDFKAFLGREIPMQIDTGIRVHLTHRVHKKDNNGATPKKTKAPKTAAAPETTPPAAA